MIIHYPKTKQEINELDCKVALIHAEAVKSYIKQLPCPKEQKLKLIESLKSGSE